MLKNKNFLLNGARIYLRPLKLKDVNRKYLSWLKKNSNGFIPAAVATSTMRSIRKYVLKNLRNPDVLFLAIIDIDTKKHIGNIKLGPIDWNNRNAEFGRLIGNRKFRKKGYGTEAAQLIIQYCFENLNLHKVFASCVSTNLGAIRSNKKNGLKVETIIKDKRFIKNKYYDDLILGITKKKWVKNRLKRKKLFLFDLDGVLLNSKENMRKSWKEVSRKLSLNIGFNKYFSKIGIPFEKILSKLKVKKEKIKLAKKIFIKESVKNNNSLKFYQDTKKVLKILQKRGDVIGIVTSKDYFRTLKICKKLGIKFSTLQCPDNRGQGKPNKYLATKASKEAKVSLDNTYYIGDTNIDFIFSKNSGMKFVYAKYGYGKVSSSPYKTINNISEVLNII